ncbi:MAG TPA: DUF1128 domain-containing protein [Sporosarcina sp.]|nr:DUF1128 domain-containing protein [Sporosarcina sp.]
MDLTKPTTENVTFMVEQIKEKLRMVNVDAMKSDSFNLDKYDDLVFIYKTVMKRNHISANEVEAIAAELGSLRN